MNAMKIRHRQEWDGTIVQTTNEWDEQERDDNCACNSLHRRVFTAFQAMKHEHVIILSDGCVIM